MKTKAQSQIITTVLIILLVLAAIVIVWQVVRGTVDTSTQQIGSATQCINVDLEITGLNDTETAIKVSRGSQGGTIDGIRVIYDGGTVTPDGDALDPLEGGEYALGLGTGTSAADGKKIEVAAIINGQACPVADTYTVPTS